MAIVYVTNKKTGKKYAYESVSVWNPELKQPRALEKLFLQAKSEGESLILIKIQLKMKKKQAAEEPIKRWLRICKKLLQAEMMRSNSLRRLIESLPARSIELNQFLIMMINKE